MDTHSIGFHGETWKIITNYNQIPANPLKGKRLYNVFTQYMLVGSLIKLGNIPLYEIQIWLFLI